MYFKFNYTFVITIQHYRYETMKRERQRLPKKRGEWPSGLNSSRQVTEVKLGRMRSNSGWVTTEV